MNGAVASTLSDNFNYIGFACGFSGENTVYLYEYINNGGSINDESNFVLDFYGIGQTVVNNVGLQAFDENGGLVFSSSESYENVKGIYNSVINDRGQLQPLYNETYWPEKIDLVGNFGVESSAVIINSCKHGHAADALADALYVVVFDGNIHLERRYLWSLSYSHPDYSIFNAGLKYYPPYSMMNSGIIISADGIN
jgi:hypothetical protein